MEDKKKIFVAFLDDDDSRKEIWVDKIIEQVSFVVFKYKKKQLIIPWNRILKIKKEIEDKDGE